MTGFLYYSDLTDAEWSEVEPLLPRPAAENAPDQGARLVINGILFLLRSGTPLRTAPPWSTAECYYWQWQADGTWDRITAALKTDRPGTSPPSSPDPLQAR